MAVMKEGWLVKRRVDQPRGSAVRVYARLHPDKLLWYASESPDEDTTGGVHLLGRYVVGVDPAGACSMWASLHDPQLEYIKPQFLLLDTANHSANYEFECRAADGSASDWKDAMLDHASECCGAYQPPSVVCHSISAVYNILERLCVLAGTRPALLLRDCMGVRNEYMQRRTEGLVGNFDSDADDQRYAQYAAELIDELSGMFAMPQTPEGDRQINFLKRVAANLGIFPIMASFSAVDNEKVYTAACYITSRLTVLSVEMTEKATPLMPNVLARLNVGVEAMDPNARYWSILNLIKGPTMMRQFLAVGLPSYTVRLLRRCWSVLGHPRDTVNTEAGVTDGLDPKIVAEYTNRETFALMAILQMLVHGPEIWEALELSGVKEALSHYLHNRNRIAMYTVYSIAALMPTEFPDENVVAFLLGPCPPFKTIRNDPTHSVLEAVLSRFGLACRGLPENSLEVYQTESENRTDGTVAKGSVSRFYDIREIAPAVTRAAKVDTLRCKIVKSNCIADCFFALTSLATSLNLTTQFRGREAVVAVLSSLGFNELGREAIRETANAFDILRDIGIARDDTDGRECAYDGAGDQGLIADHEKSEFVKELTGLILHVFPQRASELAAQKLDGALRIPTPSGRRKPKSAAGRRKNALAEVPSTGAGTDGASASEDGARVDDSEEHCMISYCWDDQQFVLRLAESLQAQGLKVWVDVDQMSGSTLEAMASAVENAYTVIVVLSEAYKNSTACRTEAEYAYTLKKTIVPVKNNEEFTASGWLGALMGTKLWFNFGGLGRMQYNQKVLAVVTELHRVSVRALPPRQASAVKRQSTLISQEAVVDTAHDSDSDGAAAVDGGSGEAPPSTAERKAKSAAAWQTATKAVLQGHAPVALHELENAVHHAVSVRLREIFAVVTSTGGGPPAPARVPTPTSTPTHDAFLNHVLDGTS